MVRLDDSLMWWRVKSRGKDSTINYSSLLADPLASWLPCPLWLVVTQGGIGRQRPFALPKKFPWLLHGRAAGDSIPIIAHMSEALQNSVGTAHSTKHCPGTGQKHCIEPVASTQRFLPPPVSRLSLSLFFPPLPLPRSWFQEPSMLTSREQMGTHYALVVCFFKTFTCLPYLFTDSSFISSAFRDESLCINTSGRGNELPGIYTRE